MYTVYSLRTPDGRVYVGATSLDIMTRWRNGNGYRFNPDLWKEIQSHGWESIIKTIHGECLTQNEASLLEQRLISEYDSTNPLCGYNRELGGIAHEKLVSSVTRERHSKSVSGTRNHNFGVRFSETHRKRISESNTGLRRSPETCANIGKSHEKPVGQYTTCGVLIQVWDSARKAALATGVQAGHISKVCNGQRTTAGGYVWRYA